jgi:thymidylate synthase
MTDKQEQQYLDLLVRVLETGEFRGTRNSVTKSVFHASMKFDLTSGTIPLLTTKFVSFKNVLHELLWFLSGSTDVSELSKHTKIWNANSSKEFILSQNLDYGEGIIGPGYGYQFRNSGGDYPLKNGFDQIKYVEHLIKTDPTSRRICMSLWSPSDIKKMVLPNCHGSFIQFYVRKPVNKSADASTGKSYLDCFTHQRSCDLYLGCPYNIASYSILVNILAASCNLIPGVLTYSFGDVHLYKNQLEAAKLQSARTPAEFPVLCIKEKKESIIDYTFNDLTLSGYEPDKTPLPKVKMVT